MTVPPRPAPATAPIDADTVQALLDAVPAPLEPLDASMLDGYLCAVLLQPKRVAEADWFPPLLDAEGRAAPAGFDAGPLRDAVRRRLNELNAAIDRRTWFDPWVYELDEDTSPSDTVAPWVTGFAHACALFPALMDVEHPEMLEPLAVLYMHLDPDELEDADELLAEIETLEPPQDLPEAVEGLVRSTLLIADVTRPVRRPDSRSPARTPARKGPPRKKPGPPASKRR
jgi:uncharacterized protein